MWWIKALQYVSDCNLSNTTMQSRKAEAAYFKSK